MDGSRRTGGGRSSNSVPRSTIIDEGGTMFPARSCRSFAVTSEFIPLPSIDSPGMSSTAGEATSDSWSSGGFSVRNSLGSEGLDAGFLGGCSVRTSFRKSSISFQMAVRKSSRVVRFS